MSNKCGIYKITSPSGRIYIGESKDIENRWSGYKRIKFIKEQRKLYYSFKKHGINNHTFEIIEECLFEDLLCRERYWQDFYDVLNGGLNCTLTQCGKVKKEFSIETREKMRTSKLGKLNPQFKGIKKTKKEKRDIVCLITGVFYFSTHDAAKAYNINVYYLRAMLNGNVKNRTSLIYSENYIKDIQLPKIEKYSRKWTKKIIDTSTGIVYESAKEVSEKFNLVYKTLQSKLSNTRKNNTTFKYLQDGM